MKSPVLLIENDFDCASLLSTAHFELTRVELLEKGLEKINSHSFDLVLLELAVVNGHSEAAFSQIRSVAPLTPVVVLATVADQEVAKRTLAIGAQDYVFIENLTASLLNDVIFKCLERHRCAAAQKDESLLFEVLMASFSDLIYFKDVRSRYIKISNSMAQYYGLDNPEQAVGKSDADFYNDDVVQKALMDEKAIMCSGRPVVGKEEILNWPDGKVSWVFTTKMPLMNQFGRIIGTIGISRDITERKQTEIALAETNRELLKQKRQMDENLQMARELQIAMLPNNFPVIASLAESMTLKFHSIYLPSGQVSGDFYDVLPLSETSVGIFICDAMGHDVRAALITTMIRSLVADLGPKAANPGEFLSDVNKALCKVFKKTGTTMYATAFYLVVDVANKKLCYACAAHPNPLQMIRCESKLQPLGSDPGGRNGPALGLFEDSKFPTYHRSMHAEDIIVLYTDGLIEEENLIGDVFSLDRLGKTIQEFSGLPASELLAEILEQIRRFSGQQKFSDDVCLLGVEINQEWSEPSQ